MPPPGPGYPADVLAAVRRHRIVAMVVIFGAILLAMAAYRATRGDDIPEGPCSSDVVNTCEQQTYPGEGPLPPRRGG